MKQPNYNVYMRAYMRKRRANETPKQRAKRLKKQRKYDKKVYNKELRRSKKANSNNYMRIYMRKRRKAETPEQRSKRLERQKEYNKKQNKEKYNLYMREYRLKKKIKAEIMLALRNKREKLSTPICS